MTRPLTFAPCVSKRDEGPWRASIAAGQEHQLTEPLATSSSSTQCPRVRRTAADRGPRRSDTRCRPAGSGVACREECGSQRRRGRRESVAAGQGESVRHRQGRSRRDGLVTTGKNVFRFSLERRVARPDRRRLTGTARKLARSRAVPPGVRAMGDTAHAQASVDDRVDRATGVRRSATSRPGRGADSDACSSSPEARREQPTERCERRYGQRPRNRGRG